MAMFRRVLARADLDVVLSYNHYTLQNTMLLDLVPELQARGVGIMNAAPFSARLLTDAPLPAWHKATPTVRATVKQAADLCRSRGSEIAKLALQYALIPEALSTCVVGSANPANIARWADWAAEPIDEALLRRRPGHPRPDPRLALHGGAPREQRPAVGTGGLTVVFVRRVGMG